MNYPCFDQFYSWVCCTHYSEFYTRHSGFGNEVSTSVSSQKLGNWQNQEDSECLTDHISHLCQYKSHIQTLISF